MTRGQRPTSRRMRATSPLRWTSSTCPQVQTRAPGDPGAVATAPVSRVVPLGSNRAHVHPGTEQLPDRTLTNARPT